jgi:hypothetical protein
MAPGEPPLPSSSWGKRSAVSAQPETLSMKGASLPVWYPVAVRRLACLRRKDCWRSSEMRYLLLPGTFHSMGDLYRAEAQRMCIEYAGGLGESSQTEMSKLRVYP